MAGQPIVDQRRAAAAPDGKTPAVRFNCVVLTHADGPECSDELLQGLTKRGGRVQIVADPAAVLVQLARGEVGAVIVEQPKQIRRLSELLTAIHQYYPKTVCWHFDSVGTDGRGRLARFDAATLAAEQPDQGRDVDHHQDPIPLDQPQDLLQLHQDQQQEQRHHRRGEDEATPDDDPAQNSNPDEGPFQIALSSPLITEDEMAMLLGSDGDETQVDADDEALEMEAQP